MCSVVSNAWCCRTFHDRLHKLKCCVSRRTTNEVPLGLSVSFPPHLRPRLPHQNKFTKKSFSELQVGRFPSYGLRSKNNLWIVIKSFYSPEILRLMQTSGLSSLLHEDSWRVLHFVPSAASEHYTISTKNSAHLHIRLM
jgi:hypothetical protein